MRSVNVFPPLLVNCKTTCCECQPKGFATDTPAFQHLLGRWKTWNSSDFLVEFTKSGLSPSAGNEGGQKGDWGMEDLGLARIRTCELGPGVESGEGTCAISRDPDLWEGDCAVKLKLRMSQAHMHNKGMATKYANILAIYWIFPIRTTMYTAKRSETDWLMPTMLLLAL